jgi:hypothetical protein
MSKRLKRILSRWKQTEMAWNDGDFEPDENQFVRLFLSQADFEKSGRMMWNLGMWLDTAWQQMDADLQVFTLKRITQLMLKAKHNRAKGLWKLGETLGQHIGTADAKAVLLQVLNKTTGIESQHSALHGLVHFASDHPKARQALIRKLNELSIKQGAELGKDYQETIQAIEQRKWCINSSVWSAEK